jgi:hypothetical protein
MTRSPGYLVRQRSHPEWLFHTALFMPSLVMVSLQQSSMAAGLVLYLVSLVLYFFVKNAHRPWRCRYSLLRPFFLAAMIPLGFVFFHAWALLGAGSPFNVARFLGGFFIFLMMIFCAICIAGGIVRLPENTIPSWVRHAMWFMLANALLGLTGVPLFPQTTHKPVGMFSEPSHFVLVLGPMLAYVCAVRCKYYGLILIAVFLWGLLVQNMTTIVIVLLCSALVFRLSWRIVLFPVGLLFVALLLDIEYFVARLMISGDSDNQSVLVLLQGWETALILMENTHGWGAGFQQFGFVDAVGDIGARIASGGEDGLNKFDGGSTAAKLVGEFGFFGIGLLICYMLFFVRSFLFLRNSQGGNKNNGEIFLAACFFMFVVELFVRGVGYFSPTLFLAMAAAMRLPVAHDCVVGKARRIFL